MKATIDTSSIRQRLAQLTGYTRKGWKAATFCKVRKEDGSWHESSKIGVQRGVYGSMAPADAELAAAAPELHATVGALCGELESARAEIHRLRAELEAAGVGATSVAPEKPDLATRMKAAGMLSIEEMMAPLNRFQIHAGMTDMVFFEQWLERKAREYAEMSAELDLDDAEDKELQEWVTAHRGAFHEALVNFRAAKACEAARQVA